MIIYKFYLLLFILLFLLQFYIIITSVRKVHRSSILVLCEHCLHTLRFRHKNQLLLHPGTITQDARLHDTKVGPEHYKTFSPF